MNKKKAVLIVVDSCGVGALPDAKEFGDEGVNTLANLAKASGGISLPNLEKIGLGNIIDIEGVARGSPLLLCTITPGIAPCSMD